MFISQGIGISAGFFLGVFLGELVRRKREGKVKKIHQLMWMPKRSTAQ